MKKIILMLISILVILNATIVFRKVDSSLDDFEIENPLIDIPIASEPVLDEDEEVDDVLEEIPPLVEDEIIEEIEKKDELLEKFKNYLYQYRQQNSKYSFTVYGNNSYSYSEFRSAFYFLNEEISISSYLIKSNTLPRPGINRDIKWIVIHDTGNNTKTANAYNHANYLYGLSVSNTTYTSWHYTVDDKSIFNHIPDNEVAYHAGDSLSNVNEFYPYLGGGNKNGIGIEMCVNNGNNMVYTFHRTAKLVANLLVKYGLSLDNVKPHYAFSGKLCPNTTLTNNMWEDFMKYVRSEYELIKEFSNVNISFSSLNGIYSNGLSFSNEKQFCVRITNNVTNISKELWF